MTLPALAAEFENWRAAGLSLPVWWRDDDAIRPTPELDRLLALAERADVDLHLAVVPALAMPALAERLREQDRVFVLSHGWRHTNHAPADQKKAEFGVHRPTYVMIEEICSGKARIEELFATQAVPIFTPPWNRVAPDVVGELSTAGFKGVSTFLPRIRKYAAPGLLCVNTHFDPINWKNGGGLVDIAVLDTQLARDLAERRLGSTDNTEPYGILTHHLVQDEATWEFVRVLLEVCARSGVVRWTSPLANP